MKTAVITGSTRGLGFEMAKRFHAAGWNLVLNGEIGRASCRERG